MSRQIKYWYHRAKHSIVDGFLKQGYRRRIPRNLIIETTNRCSLRCSCCPNGVSGVSLRPRGMMTRETFEKVLSHLDVPMKQCYLHMCGEPFLSKDLEYFVNRLKERGIMPIIYSNGYNIDFNALDTIVSLKGVKIGFSMDVLTAEHYEKIRVPGRYEEALKSLDAIDAIFTQHDRYYGLNIIVNKDTCDSIQNRCAELFEQYKHLNTIQITSAWPWPKLPNTGDLLGHVSKKYVVCNEVNTSFAVLWNGDVSFCSLDYSGESIIGSMLKEKYSELWNGSNARRMRRRLQYHSEACSLCKNCALPHFVGASEVLHRRPYLAMNEAEKREVFYKTRNYHGIEE